jgi:ABC-type antimicrobial peptide transport system permease subunit
MILFYSDTCQHCSVLLDTIKRHDTKKTIKLVVIDAIINKISHKIKAVPALMFMPSKEIIYGKAVFDYLLLPNRGYLFTTNNTRDKQETSSITSPIPLNIKERPDEPIAFTLGSISSDNFSDITDDNINSMNINDDKLYKWGLVNEISDTNDNGNGNVNGNGNGNGNDVNNNKIIDNDKMSKKLPSIDELQKQRENIFKDI